MARSALTTTLLFTLLTTAQAAYDPQNLFPIAVQSGFTTAPSSSTLTQTTVTRVELSDAALGVIKVSSGTTHNVTSAPGNAPPNTLAWEAFYAKGSFNPDGTPRGGFGFYLNGPSTFDFTAANELLFSYAVMFEEGFQFNMGGKLPGPYGGTSATEAFACSGGRQTDRDQCFDLRLMWRTNGAGEIYAYLPEVSANTASLGSLSGTVEDKTFGLSVARGAFSFAVGDWTVVAQRVKLNTFDASGAANADGELELWVNGKSVIHATQVVVRSQAASVFRGAHMQTFFGGDTPDWASPQDQMTWFADISAASVAPGASPAEGKAAYPLGNGNVTVVSGTGTTGTTGGSGSSSPNGSGRVGTALVLVSLIVVLASVLIVH